MVRVSAGFAESYRSGPDIAYTLDPDPRRPFLRNQVRSTAARGFTNGRLWWIDADALLVRDPFGPDDARGSLVSMAVSGGAWLPSGWDTSPLLELARPDDQVPTRWAMSNGWTGLLNLSDAPVEVEGPGGTEVLTGAAAEAGPRTLGPGLGELWRP